jgi:NACHT domain
MNDPSLPSSEDDSDPNPETKQEVRGNRNQVIGKAIRSIIVNGKFFCLTIIHQIPKNLLPPLIEVVPTLTTQNETERQILLTKVKSRVNRGLARSLHKIAEIELGFEDCVRLVQQDDDDADYSDISRDVLQQGTQVTDIFDRNLVGRTLAIFGEPGSGKTIMLLKLAEEMISRTEQDSGQPIPVVFNLSSWTIKPQSIEQWLIEEIDRKYGFGKAIGKNWVETQALMLFLDGLDEVKVDRRNDCVEALNKFMKNHVTTEIVICCRIEDYENLDARLSLQNAICIQPLNSQQIHEYLDLAGEQLSAVKMIVQRDRELQKLATSPLMLSIMSLAYKGYTPEEIPQGGSIEDYRKRLFSNYIDEMFKRRVKLRHRNRSWIDRLFKRRKKKKKEPEYHRKDTESWLIWLAQQMKAASQSEFLIEGLQPSWLPSKWERFFYRIESGLIGGLVIFTIFALITFPLEGLKNVPINLLTDILLYTLLTFSQKYIKPIKISKWSWQEARNGAISGFTVAFLSGLIFVVWKRHLSISEITKNLALMLIRGILFIPLFVKFKRHSKPVGNSERFSQKTTHVVLAIFIAGLLGYIIFDLLCQNYTYLLIHYFLPDITNENLATEKFILALAKDLVAGMFLTTFGILIGGIFSGFRDFTIQKKITPNEGILISSRSALFVFIIVSIIVGLSSEIFIWLITGRINNIFLGLYIGLYIAVFAGLILGGSVSIRHYVLRFVLCRKRYAPWNYAQFLDYASEKLFLRKVGGGYEFVHRMLQEHFAEMTLKQTKR